MIPPGDPKESVPLNYQKVNRDTWKVIFFIKKWRIE